MKKIILMMFTLCVLGIASRANADCTSSGGQVFQPDDVTADYSVTENGRVLTIKNSENYIEAAPGEHVFYDPINPASAPVFKWVCKGDCQCTTSSNGPGTPKFCSGCKTCGFKKEEVKPDDVTQ